MLLWGSLCTITQVWELVQLPHGSPGSLCTFITTREDQKMKEVDGFLECKDLRWQRSAWMHPSQCKAILSSHLLVSVHDSTKPLKTTHEPGRDGGIPFSNPSTAQQRGINSPTCDKPEDERTCDPQLLSITTSCHPSLVCLSRKGHLWNCMLNPNPQAPSWMDTTQNFAVVYCMLS